MSDFLLADRAESALVDVLSTAITPTPCYPAKYNLDKSVPIVLVECQVGGELVLQTGIYYVEAKVTVKTLSEQQPDSSDDPKTAALALLSLVHNVISASDLEAQLTASPTEFSVYETSIKRTGGTRSQDEQGYWIDEINLRFVACAFDLS